jgi:hypothetical protein
VKRQPKRGDSSKALPEIQSVKYSVDDFVEVAHPADRRRQAVCGNIRRIWTDRVDGLDPVRGMVQISRPFEHEDRLYDFSCAQLLNRVDIRHARKIIEQMQRKLPASLMAFHQRSEGDRQGIEAGMVYVIRSDEVDNFQLSFDVLDVQGQLLESGIDRLRVVLPKDIAVKIELWDENRPMTEPKSKRNDIWTEVLGPFLNSHSRQYNTSAGDVNSTALPIMLRRAQNSRARVKAWLVHDGCEELKQHTAPIIMTFKLKVEAGE